MSTTTHLYPGVRPFETKEQHLFFGRNRDIESLYELILLERLTVLFGKSGYGKSSLLQAGIIPRFTNASAPKSKQYKPIQIRFGTYVAGKSLSPLNTLVNALDATGLAPEYAYLKTLSPRLRLWHHFKIQQALPLQSEATNAAQEVRMAQDDSARFLLFFDQFEEFFSYPEADQVEFKTEFAELLYEVLPQDVRLASRDFSREQRLFLATPFDVKTILAIRSDRLSLLDGMKDRLPAILHKRYELKAMDESQAREAIVMPAAGVFTFTDEALAKIISELSGKDIASKGRIETFQLQIVCSSIERRVNEQNLKTVALKDLPDFKNVYEDYYQSRIAELPADQQAPACQVLENGLLLVEAQSGEARRLSRDSVELAQAFGVSMDLLTNLERSYLIRREINSLGGFSFEISHDTLIAPMLKARKAREALLEQKRQEQERAEALQRAKEAEAKALEETARREEAERLKDVAVGAKKRANVFAIGAGALAILAILAFLFAQIQSKIAEDQRDKAKSARILADSSAADALRQKQSAESSALFAQNQKMKADTLRKVAEFSLDNMEKANDKLVDKILSDAHADIELLHYEAAMAKCTNAAALGRRKSQIAAVLLEVAYFLNETGQQPKAAGVLSDAAGLLGKHALLVKTDTRASLHSALQKMDAARFAEFEKRYYPNMVSVKGETHLSDFKIAESGTTVWQFHLYLSAQGKSILDPKTIEQPKAGWHGKDAVVFVSWYDAALYANWLSGQRGLSPFYTIAREQKDTNNISDIDRLKWTVVPNPNSNGYRLPTVAERVKAGRSRLTEANSEWCWDWYAENPSSDATNNPQGPSFGRYRVTLRSSDKEKGRKTPDGRTDQVGFSLAQSPR